MSFKKNDFSQLTLNDSYINATARVRRMVENSWAKDFADKVFPNINEDRFSVLYSGKSTGRPNTPVNLIIGALMLKEQMGLSDEELLMSICCDIRYQYALHTTHYIEQPFSDRTFSRFRERVYQYELETGKDLLSEEMKSLASKYAEYMNLTSNIKRMDSMMVASNIKRMSRLEIIYVTVSNALKLMVRDGHESDIPEELKHYLGDDDRNDVIYHCKGDDADTRLEKVINEAAKVKELMSDEKWTETSEYQLLVRVLSEQAEEKPDGSTGPKPKHDITSDSLQNPSDPDATYREKAGKKHKGYVGNFIETVGDDGTSLITDASYDKNTHSDSDFCKEYLNSRSNDDAQETMIADGAYGGQDNMELARSKNVELIPTALTGADPDPVFADFKLSDDGTKILECPMGHKPVKSSFYAKTQMCRAKFPLECCAGCPYRDRCKAKQQRNSYAVHVSAKTVARAEYRKKLSTEEYKALTRKRNAIEGIPSVFRRKFNVDRIPVRGLIRTKQFFMLKVCAYNNGKLFRYLRRLRENFVQNAVPAAI